MASETIHISGAREHNLKDLHLELPPFGVTEVPDHLRELFLESSYLSAERVFETVLAEEAEWRLVRELIRLPRIVNDPSPPSTAGVGFLY